jgi:hypothetical protein
MIIVMGNWSVESLFFPFDDVLKLRLLVPGGVGDESIFVLEGPGDFFADFSTGKPEIGKFSSSESIRIKIGVYPRYAFLVGSIEPGNSVPDFSLNFKIVLELIVQSVVLLNISSIVVLVEFGMHIFRGMRILMRQCWIGFIVDKDIVF